MPEYTQPVPSVADYRYEFHQNQYFKIGCLFVIPEKIKNNFYREAVLSFSMKLIQ